MSIKRVVVAAGLVVIGGIAGAAVAQVSIPGNYSWAPEKVMSVQQGALVTQTWKFTVHVACAPKLDPTKKPAPVATPDQLKQRIEMTATYEAHDAAEAEKLAMKVASCPWPPR